MASSKSVVKSSHLAFLGLKRLLNGVGCGTIPGLTATQIGRCCVMDPEQTSHTYSKCLKIQRWGPGCIPSFILHCWMILAVSHCGWVTICLNLTIARPLLRRYPLWCIPRGYCGCVNLLLRCEAWFFVPVEGVGMVQVVVFTGSVQRHREAPQ